MVNVSNSHVSGGAVTTVESAQVSPTLLCSEVDKRVARLRPGSTPLDQISRLGGARGAGSMKVQYYSVDMKDGSAVLSKDFKAQSLAKNGTFEIEYDDPTFLAQSDTVLFPNSRMADGQLLIGYVEETNGRKAVIRPLNLARGDDGGYPVAAMPKGEKIVRMGRAAGELDVQTSQYNVLPTKKEQLCQIFKAQIEESMLHRLSDKEVGWSFSDQEEAAILDMRMCMERSFLFGRQGVLQLSDGKEVMLTGGIWHQTDNKYEYKTLDSSEVVSMMRKAFSGGNGSTKKILLAGSGLLEKLSNLEYHRVLKAGDRVTKWGVDFDQIVSKFGTLYVTRCEVFDLCGMDDYGMVIDPEFLTKYSHIPFSAERISFHKQGVRNTEAVVLTEASCLVLRFPDSHMKIMPEAKE